MLYIYSIIIINYNHLPVISSEDGPVADSNSLFNSDICPCNSSTENAVEMCSVIFIFQMIFSF